jgi:hypothetical protein
VARTQDELFFDFGTANDGLLPYSIAQMGFSRLVLYQRLDDSFVQDAR